MPKDPLAHGTSYRLERDFRKEVVAYAKAKGWTVHWEVDHRFKPTTGFVDLVLARVRSDAHKYPDDPELQVDVLFRELKMPGTYLKPAQDDWRVLLVRGGLDHGVWRPNDWPRIEQELS